MAWYLLLTRGGLSVVSNPAEIAAFDESSFSRDSVRVGMADFD
jgi:hypothetical protein